MQTAQYFYITTLPALGELGSTSPMGLVDLIEHVREHKQWREQLEALALLDDLLQRESLLAGEMGEGEVEPAVLSMSQMQGDAPLPEKLILSAESEQASVIEADLLWEGYFRYVHELGFSEGSQFLVEWVQYEVALRNALAAARSRRLGLEESDYRIADDLANADEDLGPVVSAWEAAPTPLAGLREVIRGRWSWIERHDAWFSFSIDELLAYAARIMLLEQWRRIEEQEEEVAT